MKRHPSPSPIKAYQDSTQPLLAILVLTLSTLACGFLGSASPPASDEVIILRRLYTLTPTRASAQAVVAESTTVAVVSQPAAVEAGNDVSEAAVPPVAAGSVGLVTNSGTTPVPSLAGYSAVTSLAQSPASTPTPTSTPAASPTLVPTGTPTTTPTEVLPSPTPTVTPSPSATPLPVGWVFNNVRAFYDEDEDGLRLLGNVINNTGHAQEVQRITGTFFNGQGQAIDDPDIIDYWPLDPVPHGAQMPFDLIVTDIDSAANFELRVEAEPSGEHLQHDFLFTDLNTTIDGGDYCITGLLQSPEDTLEDYVVVVAVLYDDHEQVINFNAAYEFAVSALANSQAEAFENCVAPLNQTVARYELRAWGL